MWQAPDTHEPNNGATSWGCMFDVRRLPPAEVTSFYCRQLPPACRQPSAKDEMATPSILEGVG
eukprot:9126838-Pyramimonas_sp.AAC.1